MAKKGEKLGVSKCNYCKYGEYEYAAYVNAYIMCCKSEACKYEPKRKGDKAVWETRGDRAN